MPTIQHELKKLINTWDTEEAPKKSLSERVFEFVKNNPNASIKDLRKSFPVKEEVAISSALTTLVNRGILGRIEVYNPDYSGAGKKTHYIYKALVDECITQVKGYSSAKDKVKKEKKLPKIKVMEERFPKIESPKEITPPPKFFSAEALVESLSVTQAKEVYIALKAIFESRLM